MSNINFGVKTGWLHRLCQLPVHW